MKVERLKARVEGLKELISYFESKKASGLQKQHKVRTELHILDYRAVQKVASGYLIRALDLVAEDKIPWVRQRLVESPGESYTLSITWITDVLTCLENLLNSSTEELLSIQAKED